MIPLALLLLAPGAAAQGNPAHTVGLGDLTAWRGHLAPSEEETRWRTIPWRATTGEGLRDSARAEKPMLLWLMNGHPLGCT